MGSEKILRQLGELEGLRELVDLDAIILDRLQDTFGEIIDDCIHRSGENLEQVANFLFNSSIDIESWSYQVMGMSCRQGNLDLIIRLMDAGFQPDEKVYDYAIHHRQEEVVIFFLKKDIPIWPFSFNEIFEIGLIKVVRTLIELGQDVKKFNQHSMEEACRNGHIELIKLLLSKPEYPIDLNRIINQCYLGDKGDEIKALIEAELYRRRALVKSCLKKG